ncbi:unnamed protein product [Cyprideis torosa]|uniref:Uncharacterized protein n=1 Tax=Cyprideis torosa TaxID=163714 RepID=A0A7R8ZHT9_9CRUS|nr:unnamed protein product [Cyprideis torosa]CAG0884526.1 unnamed protein product [Cyprideis torosa]
MEAACRSSSQPREKPPIPPKPARLQEPPCLGECKPRHSLALDDSFPKDMTDVPARSGAIRRPIPTTPKMTRRAPQATKSSPEKAEEEAVEEPTPHLRPRPRREPCGGSLDRRRGRQQQHLSRRYQALLDQLTLADLARLLHRTSLLSEDALDDDRTVPSPWLRRREAYGVPFKAASFDEDYLLVSSPEDYPSYLNNRDLGYPYPLRTPPPPPAPPSPPPYHLHRRSAPFLPTPSPLYDPSSALVPFKGSYPRDLESRLQRLEGDKESLSLQVSVLQEQIEAQEEKILELERTLEQKQAQLAHTEEVLQKEFSERSSLENHKLELLTEISQLHLKHSALERENLELRELLVSAKVGDLPPRAATSPPLSSFRSKSSERSEHNTSDSPVLVGARRESPHHVTFGGSQLENGDPGVPKSPSVDEKRHKRSGGFRDFLGRIKRVGSGGIGASDEEASPRGGDLRRGGHRATAGPRLGWSHAGSPPKSASPRPPRPMPYLKDPITSWSQETCLQWLDDLGLGMYLPSARNWIQSGQQLAAVKADDLERHVGIKNPLHRKKLLLAIAALVAPRHSGDQETSQESLDTAALCRWLDDLGMPQYKEAFNEARLDGRVLNELTVEEVTHCLKVNSLLHLMSLRRGLQVSHHRLASSLKSPSARSEPPTTCFHQVLRLQEFDLSSLRRRSSPDESSGTGLDPDLIAASPSSETARPKISPHDVALWTNHRVMEWLKTIDLSEYAPNLRGSGVHGGLLVYEPRFSGELLASLLSIPAHKTLLRRHLVTHFKDLVGREILQEKRDAESSPGFVPLSPTTKIKVISRGPFMRMRRKGKPELGPDDMLCPLDVGTPATRRWRDRPQL